MPKSLQELSDRLDIQDLQAAYSHAIDTRDFDALDRVFTQDAFIDYTAFGGTAGSVEETKAFLRKALGMFGGFQHMVATSQVKLSGNRATAKTICWNPMVLRNGGASGEPRVFFCGLWYHDEYLRTLDGWRITRRVEEKCFTHNMPSEFSNPDRALEARAADAAPKAAASTPARPAKKALTRTLAKPAKRTAAKAAKKPAAKSRKK
jgi:hypothetical protein